jgi:hypothetical protein
LWAKAGYISRHLPQADLPNALYGGEHTVQDLIAILKIWGMLSVSWNLQVLSTVSSL